MDVKKKVVLISSGQPSLNPRLVKEADALTEAGYQVLVLYAYWNDWGTKLDQEILPEKKWSAICIGGDPKQRRAEWYLSRLIHKTFKYILQKTGNYNYFSDVAIARSSFFLIQEAKRHRADLYIAHNLGALPAAYKASELYKKPCGFDAEDFHRQEVTDDINSYNFKISSYIEDKYLPQVSYITASSPVIAEKYKLLYGPPVTCILNVFPKTTSFSITENKSHPLKLFWFSQTIGPNRGLEIIIEAMTLIPELVELHLLGNSADGYGEHLLQLAMVAGIRSNCIHIYKPIKPEKIFEIAAQFDIGLAAEINACLNRNIALTNKLFTYIQSGLAIAASNTLSQNKFVEQYPGTGKIYSTAKELSMILTEYDRNRQLLFQTKKEAFKIGQTQLNWENESQKFLTVIKNTLSVARK
jgi:hypothetical protein